MEQMIRVSIASPQETVPIDRAKMRDVARKVLEAEDVSDAQISLAFVDNETIQRLNKRYLDHDEPTDVLSFPLSDGRGGSLQGELLIGAEVGQVQAAVRGHEVQAELALYVIHGLLHLCGYSDTNTEETRRMRERERFHLTALGLPDIAPAEE
jgi:probable rRNA maturation factor